MSQTRRVLRHPLALAALGGLALAGCGGEQRVVAPGPTLPAASSAALPVTAAEIATGAINVTADAVLEGPAGLVVRQSAFENSAGTGLVNPFLKTSTNDASYNAFNTSGTKPGTVTSNQFTRDLPLSSVPTLKIGNVRYREFRLDINEPNNSGNLLSLDRFDVYVSATGNVGTNASNRPSLGALAPRYSLTGNTSVNTDVRGNVWIVVDGDLESGSGVGDAYFYVPETAFGADAAACPYDGDTGAGCGRFVYLDVRFGDQHAQDGGNFEEFAVRRFPYVTKTAALTYDEQVSWAISKGVATSAQGPFGDAIGFDLWNGQSGTAHYQVSVDKTVTPTNSRITGTISINNPTAGSYAGVTVTDVFEGVTAALGAPCNAGPIAVPANSTVQCSYTIVDLSGVSVPIAGKLNTATASIPLGEGVALDVFGTRAIPAGTLGTTIGSATINVTDSYEGALGTASDDRTFAVYDRTFACAADQGSQVNTATIVETGQTDQATVTVNCHSLSVTKSATPAFARTYSWTIDKKVKKQGAADGTYGASAAYDMFVGDEGVFTYRVIANRSQSDAQYTVGGTITIANPSASSGNVTVTNVVDAIASAGSATVVSCTSGGTVPTPANAATHRTLAPGTSFACAYTYTFASDPGTGGYTNTATATGRIAGGSTQPFAGSAPFTFAGVSPSINGYATVNLTDAYNGGAAVAIPGGTSYASGTPLTYDRTRTCTSAGTSNAPNTAAIVEIPAQTATATATIRCHELAVTKTANASLTRTWSWTLLKEIGTYVDGQGQTQRYPNPVLLSVGQTFAFGYKVTATAAQPPIESQQAAAGIISIHNPAPVAAKIASVVDVVERNGGSTAGVVSNAPATIAAGATAQPTYTVDLSGSSTDGLNRATASTQKQRWTGTGTTDIAGTVPYSGTAAVDFPGAITRVNDCVNVYDDQASPQLLGTVCADAATRPFAYDLSPKSFEYTDDLAAPTSCSASVNHVNTASTRYRLSDGQVGGQATADQSLTVVVNSAACETGCTLTRGYWQTHNGSFGLGKGKNSVRRGPPIHDWTVANRTAWNGWDLWHFFEGTPEPTVVNASTNLLYPPTPVNELPATGNQATWYGTFWTAPAGNPYYQASAQFMAALLNRANGASTPAAVGSALSSAWAFFLTADPATQWSDAQRANLVGWAGTFAQYNEGSAGVRHCDEDATSIGR